MIEVKIHPSKWVLGRKYDILNVQQHHNHWLLIDVQLTFLCFTFQYKVKKDMRKAKTVGVLVKSKRKKDIVYQSPTVPMTEFTHDDLKWKGPVYSFGITYYQKNAFKDSYSKRD